MLAPTGPSGLTPIRPLSSWQPGRTRGRVVVVSASFGAGHDGAAAEIGRQLRAAGFGVEHHDFVDVVPGGGGKLARSAYRRALLAAPRSWDWILDASGDQGAAGRVSSALDRVLGTRMRTLLGADPTAVISTYPLASQVLGRLRRNGALATPVATFLTDMSVHPLWVAPGVDAHLALHSVPAAQAAELGAAGIIVAGAAVHPDFRPARDAAERLAARSVFGLPADRKLALVVAGSWGVGDIRRSARDLAATGLVEPVVVCGTNTALRRRLQRDGVAHALGWVDQMPLLLRGCDVVVQNAGGLTSLEALASGVPVLTYRALPGHGRTNAAALEEAGWAGWARHPQALGAMLPDGRPPALPRLDVSNLIGWLGDRASA